MTFIHHNLMNPLLWINILYMCFFAYMIFFLLKFVLIFWFMFWPIVKFASGFYHASFSCNDNVYYLIKQSKGYCECTKDHLDNPLLCSFTKTHVFMKFTKIKYSSFPLSFLSWFFSFFPSIIIPSFTWFLFLNYKILINKFK